MYAKDLTEPVYQLLIEKRENARIKHLNDLKAFIEFSNTMDDDYNLNRKRKVLIVFDYMIADIMSKKNEPFMKEYLFHSPKRSQIKFNSSFGYEN